MTDQQTALRDLAMKMRLLSEPSGDTSYIWANQVNAHIVRGWADELAALLDAPAPQEPQIKGSDWGKREAWAIEGPSSTVQAQEPPEGAGTVESAIVALRDEISHLPGDRRYREGAVYALDNLLARLALRGAGRGEKA